MRLIIDFQRGDSVPDGVVDAWAENIKDGDTLSTESMLYAVRWAIQQGNLPSDCELYFKAEDTIRFVDTKGKINTNYTTPFDKVLRRACNF